LLKIDRQLDGITLHPDFDLWLEAGSPDFGEQICQTTRIGITQGADIPWRWYLRDRTSVSRKPRQ
jgi:DNA-3-methyladenine glycosylase